MPQSYATRVARRPAYARYKNRKKTLRQRRKQGLISPGEHRILLDVARRKYLSDPSGDYVHQYLSTRATGGGCNRACLVASGTECECVCAGVHHGVLAEGK